MSNPIDDSYTERLGPVLPSIEDARRRREDAERRREESDS